jgi:hypothetical protein
MLLSVAYAIVGRPTDIIPTNTLFAIASNQYGKNQRE